MKIKIRDHRSHSYTTQFGTCELCMFTGMATETEILFEYEDGSTEWVDAFQWDWGSLYEVYIDNLADFAHWLGTQDFDEDYRVRDFSGLEHLAYLYITRNEGE